MRTDLNNSECINLLANNYIGQLGYIYNNKPFIVPITYYFDKKNTIIGYTDDGHKTKAMRKNINVSLQVSKIQHIHNWSSVLAHGVYEELSGSEAKKQLHKFATGIKDLILRKEEINLNSIGDYSSKIYTKHPPIIFRIKVSDITGKTISNVIL